MKRRLLILSLHILGWIHRRIKDKYCIFEHMIDCNVERYNDIVDTERNRYIKKTGDFTEALRRYNYTTSGSWLMDPEDIAIKMIIKDV